MSSSGAGDDDDGDEGTLHQMPLVTALHTLSEP